MSNNVKRILAALDAARQLPVREGHFPHLANLLHRTGILSNTWTLPGCQSIYETQEGCVVIPGEPLLNSPVDVPPFSDKKLMTAICEDQAGNTTFREFLMRIWQAGVVSYRVDFVSRTVTYYGLNGDIWEENYPDVTAGQFSA
ncbi:DUF1398 family protein (plasmid) [Enterobacter sp. JBIWA008]|uniref:DUF1398 family protein n=1 Tax=Enterobacter sp. JBIWA008 TaxID=2831892 RepID=UPI001CBAF76C|nr:DUF1398 family protein [Enterobacter sp. JBIWA008]UAN43327.1 DUF1398 family protein [Enterobacter sp. JBIWA008]